jgi:Co/Zn/Cd efflux system component
MQLQISTLILAPHSKGAFFNGVFLLALALSIFLQSIERFVHIEVIEQPLLVLVVGCIGLLLNMVSALVVHGMCQLIPGLELL